MVCRVRGRVAWPDVELVHEINVGPFGQGTYHLFSVEGMRVLGYPVRLGNAFLLLHCLSFLCSSGHSNAFCSFLLRMQMQVETLPVLVLKSELPCTCETEEWYSLGAYFWHFDTAAFSDWSLCFHVLTHSTGQSALCACNRSSIYILLVSGSKRHSECRIRFRGRYVMFVYLPAFVLSLLFFFTHTGYHGQLLFVNVRHVFHIGPGAWPCKATEKSEHGVFDPSCDIAGSSLYCRHE